MPFQLDNVIPWGRSLDEYEAMFALGDEELNANILGCADGPASFNAEMTARGGSVISVDPIYRFSATEIRTRIDGTYETVMQQLVSNLDDFVWTRIPSPEALGEMRLKAMRTFLADFPQGKQDGRYLDGELPSLPFADQQFDLVLCSHFLFLYSEQLSAEFHFRAIEELLRVGREVRVFLLLTLARERSPHVEAVCEHVRELGRNFKIERVDYEFQRGGNQMLRIW